MDKIRVSVLESDPLTLDYLCALFGGSDGIEVAGTFLSGGEALEALRREAPDVLLSELTLPDMAGEDLIRQVRESFPQVAVLVLTEHDDSGRLFRALKAGAGGYLVKGEPSLEIISSVRAMAEGGVPLSTSVGRCLVEWFHKDEVKGNGFHLTCREKEVVQGLAGGKSEKMLAEDLSISSHTVHSHVKKIYRKLDVTSRTAAVMKAAQRGMLEERAVPRLNTDGPLDIKREGPRTLSS